MKQLLASILITLSISANADVIKPINTIEDAVGVVSVNGVQFDYRVTDRGWQLYADLGDGSSKKVHILLQKSFFLSYFEKSAQATKISAALNKDGAVKCQELGEIEYAEQVKFLSGYTTSLKTQIVNGQTEDADVANGFPAFANLVCLVTVEANK